MTKLEGADRANYTEGVWNTMLALFQKPLSGKRLRLQNVKAARELWAATLGCVDYKHALRLYQDMVERIPSSGRCNEFKAAAGRPLDPPYVFREESTLPHTEAVVALHSAFEREIAHLCRGVKAGGSVAKLQELVDDLKGLCTAGDDRLVHAQTSLILRLLDAPFCEARLLEEVQSLWTAAPPDIADDAPVCDDTRNLARLLGAAHRIAHAALALPDRRVWCRALLEGSIRIQRRLEALPAWEAEHANIAAARQANEVLLRSLEAQLQIPQAESVRMEPAHVKRVRAALKALQPADPLRELIEQKLQLLGAPEPEHSDASHYLSWLAKVPAVRNAAAQLLGSAQQPTALVPLVAGESLRNIVARARQLWQERIVGLEDFREDFMDALGVALRGGKKGMNWSLIGPPGVAKTTTAKILADVFDRPLVVINAAGMKDGRPLKGDPGTLRNAVPGRLAQALLNHDKPPLILIDELGKASTEFQVALTDVLTKGTSNACIDEFLGAQVPLDFSQAIFVVTANGYEGIDPSLRERFHELQYSRYTQTEKQAILRRALWGIAKGEAHLPDDVTLSATAERILLDRHKQEAGVRGVEHDLVKLCAWLHTCQMHDRLPTEVTGAMIKEKVAKDLAAVTPWTAGGGFIADLWLGGASGGQTRLQNDVVFEALDLAWRLTLHDSEVWLEQLTGTPVKGFHAVEIEGPGDEEKLVFTTRYRQSYGKLAIAGTFKPPMPAADSEDFAQLLHGARGLKVRLAVTTHDPFGGAQDILKAGLSLDPSAK